jgi:hypothetical protein
MTELRSISSHAVVVDAPVSEEQRAPVGFYRDAGGRLQVRVGTGHLKGADVLCLQIYRS